MINTLALTALAAAPFFVEPAALKPGERAKIVLEMPFLEGARSVSLHFGFNGWNLPLVGPGSGSDEVSGNINYFKHIPMSIGSGGRWELGIDVPAEARALHFAVCRDECAGGQWDNNGGRDFSWPVLFPYVGPVLTWDATTRPDSGIAVTFIHSRAASAWLRYAPADRPDDVRELTDAAATERHTFVLQGLASDTEYVYEVGSESLASARYRFRTANAAASLHALSFAAFSDAQDNGETGSFGATVAELVARHADLDFLVVAGDMPWNDHPGEWWQFFDLARPLTSSLAIMPVVGNHDTPGTGSSPDHTSFERLFQLPRANGAGFFYEFDYGPARFFALDSERMIDFSSPDGEQLLWLQNRLAVRRGELAQSPGPLWTFSYWHIPAFNAGARHAAQQFDFRPVTRGFPGVIDWDFSGHEHLGQRMRPLSFANGMPRIETSYGVAPGTGVGFLVLPAAGAVPESRLVGDPELRNLLAFPQQVSADNFVAAANGFTRVDISGASIRIRTYGAERSGATSSGAFTVRDEVRYSK